MAHILTVCLATQEAVIKALLIAQGQAYIFTYGPFADDVITFSQYQAPNINIIGGVNEPGTKVLIHTQAP